MFSINNNFFHPFANTIGILHFNEVGCSPEFPGNLETFPMGGDAGIYQKAVKIGADAQDVLGYSIEIPGSGTCEPGVFGFTRPESILPTNPGCHPRGLQHLSTAEQAHWLEPATIIACHHERGADGLPHRALKDFGTEALPFKRFPPDAAFYYLMLIAFFLFEAFKRDVLKETIPITAYATTIRRRVFDIAAKIVSTGRQLVMKLRQATLDRLNFFKLWERSSRPPLLRL